MPEDAIGPLFVAPSEAHLLPYVITALAAMVIAIALYALVRGRVLSDGAFSVMLAAGLLTIPAFTYALGDLFLLEESQQVEFCGSCHVTMSPVVEALYGEPDNLAALHYQAGAVSHARACYQCHSGYGMFGTVTAKLAGVRHMYVTATRTYEFPLEQHGKFDLDSCLNCHATSKDFRDVGAHHEPDLQNALVTGEIGCTGECHIVAHRPDSLMGAAR